MLWLSRRIRGFAGWNLLIGRTRGDMGNIRGPRDLTAFGVRDQDAGVIEKKSDGAIEFDFGFFVGRFGGN